MLPDLTLEVARLPLCLCSLKGIPHSLTPHFGLQVSGRSHGVDALTLHQAALDALSVDDFDSARVYLRQAVQLAPQARLCT